MQLVQLSHGLAICTGFNFGKTPDQNPTNRQGLLMNHSGQSAVANCPKRCMVVCALQALVEQQDSSRPATEAGLALIFQQSATLNGGLNCATPSKQVWARGYSGRHPIDGARIAACCIVGLIGGEATLTHHRPVQPQQVDWRVVAAIIEALVPNVHLGSAVHDEWCKHRKRCNCGTFRTRWLYHLTAGDAE